MPEVSMRITHEFGAFVDLQDEGVDLGLKELVLLGSLEVLKLKPTGHLCSTGLGRTA
jgi:hypothetical protein